MYSNIKVKKKLKALIKDLHHKNIEQSDIMISGIETNSKNVSNGDLFIAINGNIEDGNVYINDAIKNGALAAISNKKIIDNFENELANFVQVCPKEMIDKLENPISLKPKIKKVG